MTISIIVYSKTGITLRFAEVIRKKLNSAGHMVHLTKLETKVPLEENPMSKQEIDFTNMPDVSAADAVLFGGPVWGFNPCQATCKAIHKAGNKLKGKKVIPFITMGFPFAWMTGSGSANKLRGIAASYGAKALKGIVLTGRNQNNQTAMESLAEKISKALI